MFVIEILSKDMKRDVVIRDVINEDIIKLQKANTYFFCQRRVFILSRLNDIRQTNHEGAVFILKVTGIFCEIFALYLNGRPTKIKRKQTR